MQVAQMHSHKGGFALIKRNHTDILDEVYAAVASISALSCLTKISSEQIKIRQFGGLVFSPKDINQAFKSYLYPRGWAQWDDKQNKYRQPRLMLSDNKAVTHRFREMDGIKDNIGLEIQLGKYAFMGYDIFSKMIIFHKHNLIDYGIEIVVTQAMVRCMSTGVSSFEALQVDFDHRGEADIDIPVVVLGIEPSSEEWQAVTVRQAEFRSNPAMAIEKYGIGKTDQGGTKPGPKPGD